MAARSRTAMLLARIARRSGEPAEPAGPDPPQPTRDPRSSEEGRLEGQARLAGIVDSAMDAIVTVDSSQRILLFNRSAERMFGCTANQAIGQPLDRFVPERFRAVHARHIESFGRTGVAIRSMGAARAVHGVRSNGEEFPLEASISQVEAGEQKLYTVILREEPLRPGVRVIYMSGYTDDAVVRHGLLDREIEFLQKPFSADALVVKVRQVLDS